MALFYQYEKPSFASVYIWKIEEDADYFIENMPWHPQQLKWLAAIHPSKKIEYLASRFLIYKITGKLDSHLYKDEAGKLHLEDSHQNLSISHSGEWAGLALSEDNIGFDLQKSSDKIKTISKRFLNEEEYALINNFNDDQCKILSWTIKEAVYKANGKKGIQFSKQILLDVSELNNDIFLISKATLKLIELDKKYKIYHEWLQNFGWAVAVEK